MSKLDYPKLALTCDVPGCLRQVRRAPRIVVPSTAPRDFGHRPMRVMTTLHYCEEHRDSFNVSEYWNDANKVRLEARAKRLRPLGWKPDFENSFCEMVLVTTPEYRAFLNYIGVDRVAI